jgi:insulysin
MNDMVIIIKLMQIIKSPSDRREFRHVKLPNGLEALLVSDPLTQKAAASLSVSIGSYQDNVAGIAHFLEHMLFMGSTKYPDENQYNEVVNENGGYTNAYTDSDHTNYYFTCTPDGLFKVLDIFAQFFISPLLKEDSVQREINAVDSEYKNGLTSDAWRFQGVKREFINPSHPMSKFNVGSTETLNIPNIREIVLNFYNSNYSSDLMKLVVVGKHTLDELETNVINMFSPVPKRNVNINSEYGFMYTAPITGHIVPMKDENKLDLCWEFWLSDDYAMFHIDEFISHIIGHEGPNSLFDNLYQRFLAKSLSAGVEHSSTNHKVLSVSIHLTDAGFQKINLVRQLVLAYIDMFSRSTYDSILTLYNEFRNVKETKFRNYIVPSADSMATHTSAFWATHNTKTEHLVAHSYLFNDYSSYTHNMLTSILRGMTAENSIMFIRSKSFDSDNCLIDEWYKVKYIRVTQLPSPPSEDLTIKLDLPIQNQYICNNITMIDKIETNDPILLDINNMNIFWKPDLSFNTPTVDFRLNLVLPTVSRTIRDAILAKLYFACLEHVSNAEIYNINCANYKTSFSRTKNGITLSVNGYPEKFLNVIRLLIDSFINLKSRLTIEMYENAKTNYRQNLENFVFSQPYSMINYQLSTHIDVNTYPVDDLLLKLDTIGFSDLMDYDSLGQSVVMYGLIQGNVTKDLATEIAEYVGKLNPSTGVYRPSEYLTRLSTNEFSEQIKNPTELNSCYKLSVKIGYLRPDLNADYIKISSYLDVLHAFISEQFFDQLRTKEQLGYVVQAYKYSYGNTLEQPFITYDFCVQSPNKDATYLRDRTIQFIKEFRGFLTERPEESINKVVQSQIQTLEAPFQNLETAASSNFIMISQYCCNFNVRNDKRSFMKTINKASLTDFYDRYFSLAEGTYWSIILNRYSSE